MEFSRKAVVFCVRHEAIMAMSKQDTYIICTSTFLMLNYMLNYVVS
jgi:hypothetical protein